MNTHTCGRGHSDGTQIRAGWYSGTIRLTDKHLVISVYVKRNIFSYQNASKLFLIFRKVAAELSFSYYLLDLHPDIFRWCIGAL